MELPNSFWVSLIGGFCIGVAAVTTLRLRRSPIFLPLLALSACVSAFALGLAILNFDPVAHSILIPAAMPLSAVWYLLTLHWSRYLTGYPVSKLPDRIAQIWALLVFTFAVTNPLHGLLFSIEGTGIRPGVGWGPALFGGYALAMATLVTALRGCRTRQFRKYGLIIGLATLAVTAGHAHNLLWPSHPEVAGLIVVLAVTSLIVAAVGLRAAEQLRHASLLQTEVASQTAALKAAQLRIQAMQEGLLRAERMGAGEELAGSIAHSIHNPLTALIGTLQMAREEQDRESPKDVGQVDRLLGMAFRIRDVVDRTLALFRKRGLSLTPTDAKAVIQAAVEQVRTDPERGRVDIQITCAEPPPSLLADATLLSEALACLMTNSIQAMPSGGTLRIEASQEPAAALTRFRVIDTGPGIPPELKERVFEPYFTARSDGTGLGLAIARGIARGHSGQLRIDEQVKEGTCMVLDIPQSWSVVHPDSESPIGD